MCCCCSVIERIFIVDTSQSTYSLSDAVPDTTCDMQTDMQYLIQLVICAVVSHATGLYS